MSNDRFLYFSTAVVSLVSLGAGTVFSWTSPVLPKLKSDKSPLGYKISPYQESLISSLLCVGAIVGPIVAGQCVDRLGRKKSLLLFVLPMLISYLILAFAKTIEFYYVSRFFLGLGSACIFTVVPMYIGEIAKVTNRGILGCFTEIFITCGELMSVSVGYFCDVQMLCLINLVPFIVFAILFATLIPESPYFHFIANQEAKAEKSLQKLRRQSDVKEELDSIDVFVKESLARDRSFKDILKSKILKRAVLISIGLMFVQEMCGITVIIYYTEEIFLSISGDGDNVATSKLSPIIVSLFKLSFTIIASIFIERLGRKLILSISLIGMVTSLSSLSLFFYLKSHDLLSESFNLPILPICSVVGYIIFFSIGAGPLPWTMIGEIFPPDAKASVAPIPIFFANVYAYFGSFAFPYLIAYFGIGVAMAFFAFLGVLGLIFVLLFVPETKGRSLQEIQRDLGDSRLNF